MALAKIYERANGFDVHTNDLKDELIIGKTITDLKFSINKGNFDLDLRMDGKGGNVIVIEKSNGRKFEIDYAMVEEVVPLVGDPETVASNDALYTWISTRMLS